LSDEEREYLKSLGYFKEDFLEWFQSRFVPGIAGVTVDDDGNGDIIIRAKGSLVFVNILEVYILSIVNELYFEFERDIFELDLDMILRDGRERLENKISQIRDYPNLIFAEFGTRRRYSRDWQEEEVCTLVDKCPRNMIGTSNVYLAMKYGIKPIGTVAHEWTMSHLGLVDRIDQAQSRALYVWQQEYGQALGIALTDTFTTKAFFNDFTFPVARAYDGVRQDSGDPIKFGNDMIAHYESVGIDPKRKSIIFSDSLNVSKAINIWKHFAGRVGVAFGIGTNLSNDVGRKPLNVVMKLMSCNGKPLVKLSDDLGKTMGDPDMVERVKKAYGVE